MVRAQHGSSHAILSHYKVTKSAHSVHARYKTLTSRHYKMDFVPIIATSSTVSHGTNFNMCVNDCDIMWPLFATLPECRWLKHVLSWFPISRHRIGRPNLTWESKLTAYCRYTKWGNWIESALDDRQKNGIYWRFRSIMPWLSSWGDVSRCLVCTFHSPAPYMGCLMTCGRQVKKSKGSINKCRLMVFGGN